MKLKQSAALLSLAVLLAACGEEERLTGERFSIREPLSNSLGTESVQGAGPVDVAGPYAGRVPRGEPAPLRIPAPRLNAEWTHRNGSNRHAIEHPSLGAQPRLVWSAGIGAGDDRQTRITADPVVAGGRIFTLDAESQVTATSTAGARLWSATLRPASDRPGEASGGGLAYGAGKLFATTAFGALVALDPATGAEIWRQRLEALAAGTPTVDGDIVYITARDGQAWAIRAGDGRILWQLPSVTAPAVRVGGPGPAVTDRLVILPYGSGELIAALKQTGSRLWSSAVAGERPGRAYALLADISADPVVKGDVIYAGNPSGRVVAVRASSGERLWTATEGAVSPVWPVGDAVFLLSDQNELVRLDAATGAVVWARPLPLFVDERVKKRSAVFAHYGPVLAGGKLWVASDDQLLRGFDPQSGALVASMALPGGAASNPVVAGGTLYVVSKDGRLHAFR